MDWSAVVGINALGAFIGMLLALAFQPPKTISDLVSRACFSFLAGLVFGNPTREMYLKWPPRWEYWIASASFVAMVSWAVYGAVLGTVVRLIEAWKGPK